MHPPCESGRIVDDDWLVVTARCWPSESWWPLLRLNAGLGGPARLVRARDGQPELRGEIFVGAGVPGVDAGSLEERVAALCRDVAAARLEVDGAGVVLAGQPDASGSEALFASCRDAGWDATLQDSGLVCAALDAGAAHHQATLTIEDGGHLRAFVPLTPSGVESGDSQEAIALLLLEASSQLRAVKGVARYQKDVEVAGLALAAERGPVSPAAIDRALAALSVACRTVGREVLALQSAGLARDYLAIRGMRRTDEHASARHASEHASQQEDSPCLQLR